MSEAVLLPIVRDDPWLEPYQDSIQRRLERFQHELKEIRQKHGSLLTYASVHRRSGIHFQEASDTWTVREWAPAAREISLIGDFNDWDPRSHPLAMAGDGIWQLVLPEDALSPGERVKLHIVGADGSEHDRIPACIRRTVQDPETHDFSGQIVAPGEAFRWKHPFDPKGLGAPIIYEAHVGMAGEEHRVHSYREFAEKVLPRIKKAGYNTVQLMAVAEHPYYGSFGYHVSSFFAPSSRFGTPEELKYLVDEAHGHGLAVLMDIVHSHAIKNYAEGLNNFDGSGNQYFHADGRGEHSGWDSKCFDYGRPEVQRFLLSNLRYWLEEFRFDGFRFDGVTSLLYWHRGHTSFDHYDKYFVHDVDEDAVLYLQLATKLIEEARPGAIVIAEDMSGMPGLCRPIDDGGFGFTHRLAMGIPDYWIKLLKHSTDEQWNLEEIWGMLANRRYGEPNIAYAESHDQALVGDKTLAFWLMDQEMYWHMRIDDEHPVIERGIALHKMIRLLTLAAGGEGWLNFIGNEFGHPEWVDFPREGNDWSYHHCRRQWSLLDNRELRYRFLAAFDRAMVRNAGQHKILSAPPAQLLHVHNDNKVLICERGRLIFAFN
ncbi:MAG: 1,4-alpha-glucan-branching enzyme, partial [Akkermansiaceae bacterium]|nr:1,4-alpha-glucan-branching enzyme [Akkermansiaceae bacterium]